MLGLQGKRGLIMLIKGEVLGLGEVEKALRDKLAAIATNKVLNVGFFDSAKYPSGEGVPSVAFWQEFGTLKIPKRPFMRNAIAKYKGRWIAAFKASAQGDAPAETILGRVGEVMRGDVVKSIGDTTEPPNAPATIAQKGSSHPLIDTGFLRQSVSFEIAQKDS